jgi:antirestriction protein ArdC
MAKRTKRPRKQRDHYQEITDRILAALETDDVAPWQRPWKVSPLGGVPRNAASGRAYRGMNVFLTLMTMWERGYDVPLWLTFKQANEIAAKAHRKAGRAVEQNHRGHWVFADGDDAGQSCGGVRSGQNKDNGAGATQVIFWKPMRRTARDANGEEQDRSYLLMRSYAVFNIAQCDDAVRAHVCPPKPAEAEAPAFTPHEACERICDGYDIDTHHGGDRAYYVPAADRIQLPKPEAFDSPEHYYTTRFHEMGHSTGAAKRLGRDGIANFDYRGSHQYAEEELVAEFTACFLAGEAGIVRTTEGNSASYLRCWAAKIKEDPKIVVMAAQRAQKAADHILGRDGAKGGDADQEQSEAA